MQITNHKKKKMEHWLHCKNSKISTLPLGNFSFAFPHGIYRCTSSFTNVAKLSAIASKLNDILENCMVLDYVWSLISFYPIGNTCVINTKISIEGTGEIRSLLCNIRTRMSDGRFFLSLAEPTVIGLYIFWHLQRFQDQEF